MRIKVSQQEGSFLDKIQQKEKSAYLAAVQNHVTKFEKIPDRIERWLQKPKNMLKTFIVAGAFIVTGIKAFPKQLFWAPVPLLTTAVVFSFANLSATLHRHRLARTAFLTDIASGDLLNRHAGNPAEKTLAQGLKNKFETAQKNGLLQDIKTKRLELTIDYTPQS